MNRWLSDANSDCFWGSVSFLFESQASLAVSDVKHKQNKTDLKLKGNLKIKFVNISLFLPLTISTNKSFTEAINEMKHYYLIANLYAKFAAKETIEDFQQDVQNIASKLDTLGDIYVTKEEFMTMGTDFYENLSNNISALEEENIELAN